MKYMGHLFLKMQEAAQVPPSYYRSFKPEKQ
jgi:hypothetical protein